MNSSTTSNGSNNRIPRFAYVAAFLVGLSVVGGLLAVLIHVNTFADAYGNKSEMAMPWPTLVVTALGTIAVARWGGWRGVVGTVAVALPCVLALLSTGDTETFKPGMPAFAYVYQVIIIAASALALIPAALHIRSLVRKDPAVA